LGCRTFVLGRVRKSSLNPHCRLDGLAKNPPVRETWIDGTDEERRTRECREFHAQLTNRLVLILCLARSLFPRFRGCRNRSAFSLSIARAAPLARY